MNKQNVILEALKLPEPERLEVADLLYESLDGPADPGAEEAWDREIAERVRRAEVGESRLIPWHTSLSHETIPVSGRVPHGR